jgi:RNA recognition motif-containing protein
MAFSNELRLNEVLRKFTIMLSLVYKIHKLLSILDSNMSFIFSGLSQEQYKDKLSSSSTLYVGNLSFYTNEAQLLEFF